MIISDRRNNQKSFCKQQTVTENETQSKLRRHNYLIKQPDSCCCMILHSKCESAQYAELACHVAAWQRRHLANDNKMSDRADDHVVQRVCHGSSKIGKRKQLRILHQNVARLSLCWNNISRISHVATFVTTSRRIRTLSNFWRNLEQFPHLPEKAERSNESNHGMLKLHHTPNCS